MGKNILRKIHQEETGDVLLITFLIMVLLGMVVTLYMQRADTESKQSARSKQTSEALNYAEAGINDALWRLNNVSGWDTPADFPKTFTNKEGQGIYRVTVTAAGILYTVTSNGGFPLNGTNNIDPQKPNHTVRARMKLANYADYSRFCSGNVSYGAGARLQGALYAKGNISCSSSDIIFYKDVSCSGSFNLTGGSPDFQGTHVAGVPVKNLPPSTLSLRALARGEETGKGQGLYFGSSRDIDLGDITALFPDDSTPPNTDFPSNFNGVIYVEADARVSGIPDKGITVSANGNITIDDDIRYPQNANGTTIPNATIGLVARGEVIINDSLDSITHTELTIDASLMALNLNASNQPTGMTGWEAIGGSAGSTLTINGPIITANGGSAGAYGTRNYNWDLKYAVYTPPFYPKEIGGNYQISTWEDKEL